jgi:hypothetical protein
MLNRSVLPGPIQENANDADWRNPTPSGEQLAPARCLLMHGFVPKAIGRLFDGAAGQTGGYMRQRLPLTIDLNPGSSDTLEVER